ncbi:MAG: ComF family protein [Vulcanimicrobiaceae bacterium]
MKSGRRDILRAFACRMSSLVTDDEILVGIPSTRRRRFYRGFDGGVLLASVAASYSSTKAQSLLEARGIPQHGRSGSARRMATGRFSLRFDQGRALNVTLVDDVCTTGATIYACRQKLMEARHTVVRALTVAVVP